jgi:hypothetical protein
LARRYLEDTASRAAGRPGRLPLLVCWDQLVLVLVHVEVVRVARVAGAAEIHGVVEPAEAHQPLVV